MLAKFRELQNKLRSDEDGLSTVEYIIILILIAVLAIAVWSQFGSAVTQQVSAATQSITGLGGGGAGG